MHITWVHALGFLQRIPKLVHVGVDQMDIFSETRFHRVVSPQVGAEDAQFRKRVLLAPVSSSQKVRLLDGREDPLHEDVGRKAICALQLLQLRRDV